MKKIRKDEIASIVITCLGVAVLIYTIFNWNLMPAHQKCAGILFFAISVHVWEEMKFPGGFTEMVVKKIGMPMRDMEIPELLLQGFILYLGFILALFLDIVPTSDFI